MAIKPTPFSSIILGALGGARFLLNTKAEILERGEYLILSIRDAKNRQVTVTIQKNDHGDHLYVCYGCLEGNIEHKVVYLDELRYQFEMVTGLDTGIHAKRHLSHWNVIKQFGKPPLSRSLA